MADLHAMQMLFCARRDAKRGPLCTVLRCAWVLKHTVAVCAAEDEELSTASRKRGRGAAAAKPAATGAKRKAAAGPPPKFKGATLFSSCHSRGWVGEEEAAAGAACLVGGAARHGLERFACMASS